MNTIIFHPGIKTENFADEKNWILTMQIIGIIEILLLTAFSITLIVLKSRNKGLIRVNATTESKDFFNALRNKYPEFENNELYFGGLRRYNKHFFFKIRTGIIHFPKSWQDKVDAQSQFWLTYNFANMMDIRRNDLNFITKSIWPSLFMCFGLFFGSLVTFLVFLMPVSASGGFGLSWGGLNSFFAIVLIAITVLSNFLIILSWVWWYKMFGKVRAVAEKMISDILPKEEADHVMKMFRHVQKAPLLVNILFKEQHGKDNWDEYDPEEIINKIQAAEKVKLEKENHSN